MNQQLWARLAPQIRSLRRELFDQEAAPFKDLAVAVDWIEAQTGEGLDVLAYQKPGVAAVFRRRVPVSGPLSRLRRAVSAWVDETGLAEDALVTAVLTKAQPVLPLARVTMHHHSEQASSLSIQLFTPDLTYRQLRRLLAIVRQQWSTSAPSLRLSAKDAAVLAIRQKLGPVPGRQSAQAYWRNFMREMRKAGRRVSTVNSARVALARAERAMAGKR